MEPYPDLCQLVRDNKFKATNMQTWSHISIPRITPYAAATNFTACYFNNLYTIYTQLYTGLYLFILIIHTGF